MESLNDTIRWHIKTQDAYFQSKGLEVELDLDPDMPKIYPDFILEGGSYLMQMLAELSQEQFDAQIFDKSLTKLRYSTLHVDNTQIVIIDHNGKPIPKDTLSKLNGELTLVGNGKHRQGRVTGNVRAALQVYKGGGKIYYENHPNWEYKVEVMVQLPNKSASNPKL